MQTDNNRHKWLNLYNNYYKKITKELTNNIILAKKNELPESELIKTMNKIYNTTKFLAANLYEDGKMNKLYSQYIYPFLIECEMMLTDFKIMAYYQNFSEKNIKTITNSNDINILDYVVYLTRKKIIEEEGLNKRLSDINLTNKCLDTSYNIQNICKKLNIESKRFRINPMFYENDDPFTNFYHYFNIITIKDEKYLIDCTYSQFFNLDSNIPARIGIPLFMGCYIGYYMIINEERKNTALTLLEKGYIKCTEKNIKNYFDGFALSYRNGLYYENIDEIKYYTNYTAEDYCDFIYTEKSQLDRENNEYLGQQKRPIKIINR